MRRQDAMTASSTVAFILFVCTVMMPSSSCGEMNDCVLSSHSLPPDVHKFVRTRTNEYELRPDDPSCISVAEDCCTQVRHHCARTKCTLKCTMERYNEVPLEYLSDRLKRCFVESNMDLSENGSPTKNVKKVPVFRNGYKPLLLTKSLDQSGILRPAFITPNAVKASTDDGLTQMDDVSSSVSYRCDPSLVLLLSVAIAALLCA